MITELRTLTMPIGKKKIIGSSKQVRDFTEWQTLKDDLIKQAKEQGNQIREIHTIENGREFEQVKIRTAYDTHYYTIELSKLNI